MHALTKITLVAIIALLVCGRNGTAFAQFSGSVSGGITTTSNAQSTDTVLPDRILLPAISLQYLTEFSPITTYHVSLSSSPYLYVQNPNYSYSSTILGVGASFYLSNLAAIRAEASPEGNDASAAIVEVPSSGSSEGQTGTSALPSTAPSSTTGGEVKPATAASLSVPQDQDESASDSLVEITTTDLYNVSGGLDSLEFKGKGSEALLDARDSASELISTLADLLDSLAFSQSVKEVSLDELTDVRPLLEKILTNVKARTRLLKTFDEGVAALKAAEPQSDFLPTQGSVVAPANAPPVQGESKSGIPSQPNSTLGAIPKAATRQTRSNTADAETSELDDSPKAPTFTLITATQPFRDLTSQDFDIGENLADSGAKTFAGNLQLPFSYEAKRYHQFYNIYDYNAITFEATYESMPSERTAIDLTADVIGSNYLNDSVYTNTESRARLEFRTLISHATSIIAEGILGFKHYLTPLSVDTGKLGKRKPTTVPSSFFQYTFGAGIMSAPTQSLTLGGLFSVSTNPTLRAYIDQQGNLAQRKTASISDDEYTYNLSRALFFVQAKIVGLLLATDVSLEHRKYGSVVNRVTDAITALTGADRTESGFYMNISLTKEFDFTDARLAALFNSVSISATLGYTNVAASLPSGAAFPLYTYNDTELGFNIALGF